MKLLLIILISFFFFKDARAKTERYYQDIHCDLVNGVTEVRNDDSTRVDCLTKAEAIEYDHAKKWAECLGQALYYGAKQRKKPHCLLIGSKEDYDKYSKRIEFVIKYYNLPLKINWIEK
jgi:hypothetical protein